MPRIMDPVLSMVHERANPQTCYFTEVNAPDVARVLRRAEDQFLPPAPVSSSNIAADPAGALTILSTPLDVASFTHVDDVDVNINVTNPSPKDFRGLRWMFDSTFGRAVLKTFSARMRRRGPETNDMALQIYRVQGEPLIRLPLVPGGATETFVKRSFVPLLSEPIIWKDNRALNFIATFDLTKEHFEFGHANIPQPSLDLAGEEDALYFVITPVNASSNDSYFWVRDRTAARTIAGVGTFQDIWWRRDNENDPVGWHQEIDGHNGFEADAVPMATITIENYSATAQAVYALTLPSTPQPASVGSVVFETGLPSGTAATFELSTAGSGGPWTAMKHGDEIAIKQASYHARVTLTSDTSHRLAPKVAALGVEFKIPIDLTAEAIVEPIAHEVEVPFLKSSVGEGRATAIRFGRRNYRDVASDLATLYPVSKLEVDVFVGSRHPSVTRDKWLHLDRAMVNDRDPSPTSESLGILSYLKTLKRKIPKNIESVNVVMTVASATTTAITMVVDLPEIQDGYYIRVRASLQPGFLDGSYTRAIDGDPQTSGTKTLRFDPDNELPGTLAAGDLIEIHSASYLQQGLRWEDTDPAGIWLEILNTHLLVPLERIGRGDLGRAGRSGYPPTVSDRAPGDLDAQEKLRVTLQTKEPESADALIDQLSFLMGGVTTEIGGQIVFRQIYPLRDVTGQIVVPTDPVAFTFDSRNTAGLVTPTGLQQRITQISCNYGVNTTAVDDTAQAAQTVIGVDGDAMAWLEDQSIDDLAPATIPDDIARWCYNSADGGLYLATQLVQQIVRAASTGLRVWPWTGTKAQPQLVVGDRVAVITDQYTDYDPARKVAIRGWWAYQLCVISVQGGGTRFRGFMLGLTDAVQIKGGEGELATDEGTDKSEILSVTAHDSEDGTRVTYDIVAGAAVKFIHAHHRLWPVGTVGDPFDFSEAQHAADDPQLIIVRPDVDGHFRVTFDHPSRAFQRAILFVPRQGPPTFTAGARVFKVMLDPAPPAASAKIHATVTGATADLSIDVTAGVSDWPVRVDVYEGSPDSTPILTKTLTAAATINKLTDPVLGGRPLPLAQGLNYHVKLTNVAVEEFWFGPELADRDPLANGVVTVDRYRAEPVFRMVFDTNTDAIKITIPDGRTKSWNRAQLDAAGSPVLYTVGDTLDDASTETDLGVDEERGPYKVEYQGGGEWATLFGPAGVLNGVPSNPPNAKIRIVKSANRDTEDLYITPDSPVNEQLTVYYRDGELSTSPTYRLVVSAGDSTPLFVARLTEVGPSNFFKNVDGTGSPSAKLSGIPLAIDQVKRVMIGIEGRDSGVQAWIPWTLSLTEKPFNDSFELVFDETTHKLRAIVVAGAHTEFETIVFADNDAFTSPASTQTGTVSTGNTLIKELTLSGAQHGKTWYARATPNNLASGGGLPGDPSKASVAVPPIFTYTVSTQEDLGTVNSIPGPNGTVTLVVSDPGGVLLSGGTGIQWEIINNGTKTVESSTTQPGSGSSGTYTKTKTLDDKHPIQINAFGNLVDGSRKHLGSWAFDANKVSDVVATVGYAGTTATVTAKFDTDTVTGAAGARYRIDGGSWTNITVDATTLIGTFTVTQLTTAKQVVDIQGKNAVDGNYGNAATVEVDKYTAGPSLSAIYESLSSTTGRIVWSATGTVTVKIDGGSAGTPSASPIAITLDASVHSYLFECTGADGTKVSAPVFVPSLAAVGANVVFTSFGGLPHADDTITVSWTVGGGITPDHYSLKWHYSGVDYDDPISAAVTVNPVTSPFTHVKALGSGGHGYAISATPLPPDGHAMAYFITAHNAAGDVLASTGWFDVPFAVGP